MNLCQANFKSKGKKIPKIEVLKLPKMKPFFKIEFLFSDIMEYKKVPRYYRFLAF
jgi:hypothetical protein